MVTIEIEKENYIGTHLSFTQSSKKDQEHINIVILPFSR